ncbi:hypothetical protein ACF09L_13805 [Streptomyces sp. NPDC014779]|uniref:hypothetical protein n=1 Tax=unclassified Streptomyces TaxID=2593676 RepID=UPI0036FC2B99
MSTEPQRPVSRITEALLPPDQPRPGSRGATAPERGTDPARAGAPGPARPEPSAPARPGTRVPAPQQPEPAPAGGPARPRSLGRPLPPERPAPSAAPAEAPSETTTRLRPVRDTRPPRQPAGPAPLPRPTAAPASVPRPAAPPAPPYAYDPWALGGEPPVEITTRLRPVRDRDPRRTVAAAVCGVLALGLIGGALAGALLAGGGAGEAAEPRGYEEARALWHDAPVDTLFPQTLAGPGAGPGGANRTWTRIVVAPDAPCGPAALPRALHTALGPTGCERVLRATYTDATSSHVITVALVFTLADPAAMRTLGSRAADEPGPALSAPDTVAAGFGAAQRASWWRHVLPDLPVVVTAVSGFADGRAVAAPEPADRAMTAKRDTPVAQAGLGHEAKGVADAVERALRQTVAATLAEEDTE